MSIDLHRQPGTTLAHALSIRAHTVVADIAEKEGGDDAGPSPHDLYDAALAACKSLTVMWYARRKGIPVTDIRSTVTRDDTEERQGRYRLSVALSIEGDLTDAQLHELHTVADKCPVHKLMTSVETLIDTKLTRAAT